MVGECEDILIVKQLKQRIAELEEAQRWIPVSERLPTRCGKYPVIMRWEPREVYIGNWFQASVTLGFGWFEGGIIKWFDLPLPEPPEEE